MYRSSQMTIGENDIKRKDLKQLNDLLKQLNPDLLPVKYEKVTAVMKRGKIITLRGEGVLIGMGTLIPVEKLASFCGSIEDLVVDEKYRGNGFGRKILEELLRQGKKMKLKFVDLTSNPKRKIANNLYVSAGFERRKTNAYRIL